MRHELASTGVTGCVRFQFVQAVAVGAHSFTTNRANGAFFFWMYLEIMAGFYGTFKQITGSQVQVCEAYQWQ